MRAGALIAVFALFCATVLAQETEKPAGSAGAEPVEKAAEKEPAGAEPVEKEEAPTPETPTPTPETPAPTTETAEKAPESPISWSFCSILSGRHYDAYDDEFSLDSFWGEFSGNWRAVSFSALFDLNATQSVREAEIVIHTVRDRASPGRIDLAFGQLRVPFGYQQRLAPYAVKLGYVQTVLDLFDGGLGFWDLGVALRGRFALRSAAFEFEAALLNGEHAGAARDSTSHKAVALQLRYIPLTGFEFGLSAYDGDRRDMGGEFYQHDRFGAHASMKWRGFTFVGEYIHGSDNSHSDKTRSTDGVYLEAGFYVWRLKKYWSESRARFFGVQILARWELLCPPKNYQMALYTGHTHRNKITYTLGVAVDFSYWCRAVVYWSRLDWGRYWSGRYFGVDGNKCRAGLVVSIRAPF